MLGPPQFANSIQDRVQEPMFCLLKRERKEMFDSTVYSLTRDQALTEIIRALREERVPILDNADLSETDLRNTDLS